MLCLDESTPIVMALCLLGAVLFIVGGSFWGNGDYTKNQQQTVAGIVMFSISILLLCLSGLGCWCNRFFCTPDRKSRIALRLYRTRPPQPPPADQPADATGDGDSELTESPARTKDPDWEEYAGSYRSFRSGRNSTRGKSRRASFRRDKVTPSSSETGQWTTNSRHQQQQLPTSPETTMPPLPPHPATAYDCSSDGSNHGMVPIEYTSPAQSGFYSSNGRRAEPTHRSHREIGGVQAAVSEAQAIRQHQQNQQFQNYNANNSQSIQEYQHRSYATSQHQPGRQPNQYYDQRHQQHSRFNVIPHVSMTSVEGSSHGNQNRPGDQEINGTTNRATQLRSANFSRPPPLADSDGTAPVSGVMRI